MMEDSEYDIKQH